MYLHRVPRFGWLTPLDRPQNLGVADPAWDSLGTQRIEAGHIAERQVELTQHPLIAGQLT